MESIKTTENSGLNWTTEKLEWVIKEILEEKPSIPKFYCSPELMEQINKQMIRDYERNH